MHIAEESEAAYVQGGGGEGGRRAEGRVEGEEGRGVEGGVGERRGGANWRLVLNCCRPHTSRNRRRFIAEV